MIVTVTMNPALDKTAELDVLLPGALNRLRNVRVDEGGKGVNVSKVIQALGGASLCTGFAGGDGGAALLAGLTRKGISCDFVKTAANLRTNLKILDGENRLTELNEPGLFVGEAELRSLESKLLEKAEAGTLFVLSGSLPVGTAPDIYRKWTERLKEAGARVFVDADGAAFRQALEASPDFIKPNRQELAAYLGLSEDQSLESWKDHCRALLDKGVGCIALSMGAEGALFLRKGETLYAPGLKVQGHSPVGAGDSMVAAFAYGTEKGMDFPGIARLALATSAATVMTPGTSPPDREVIESLCRKVELKAL